MNAKQRLDFCRDYPDYLQNNSFNCRSFLRSFSSRNSQLESDIYYFTLGEAREGSFFSFDSQELLRYSQRYSLNVHIEEKTLPLVHTFATLEFSIPFASSSYPTGSTYPILKPEDSNYITDIQRWISIINNEKNADFLQFLEEFLKPLLMSEKRDLYREWFQESVNLDKFRSHLVH
jgi:hypothetical protein